MSIPTQLRRSRQPGSIRRAGGFTLVEILVTLLIVSIGLLGIAALHSFSLRNNYDALLRSHASALASDITDRMRANPTQRDTYVIAWGVTPAIDAGSPQALRDVADWKDALEDQLPLGDGRITIDGATGVVTIEVQWGERTDDPNDVDGAELVTFRTQTEI
jgi:type IV pilus assembly protein PilV